jgi:probable phosphoglycerate mutase
MTMGAVVPHPFSSLMHELKNRYYGFRHGESQANVEGVIVSDPALGTVRYGLTEKGRRQVHCSISSAGDLDSQTLVVSSDFKRAVETAEIIKEVLGTDPVVLDERLRERDFGGWEGQTLASYAEAWLQDAYSPDQPGNGTESADAVRLRMQEVIESLEEQYAARNIILVSHGDPLMILMTCFKDIPAARHRSITYIDTGEMRRLN